jgi:hypothetical protein
MDLNEYVSGLGRELSSMTRFAGEDMARAAEMLTEALESSVRLTLLDALSTAAAEITTRLDDTVIDVRLSGGEPEFVVTTTPQHEAEDAAGQVFTDTDEAGTARITLRLSESLKARVEEAAAAAGLSVNSWLAHAAISSLDGGGGGGSTGKRPPRGPRIGQRITGYARS